MSGWERRAVAARLASLSDAELSVALGDLGRSLVVPEPDDLPGSVLRRLEESGAARRSRGAGWTTWWRRFAPGNVPLRRALLLAIVAGLILAAVAAALGLGLPGIRISFGPGPSAIPFAVPSAGAAVATGPGASAPASASPTGATPGGGLALGRHVSIDEARAAAGYPVGVPGLAGLGPPDAVWLDESGPGPVVTLVWGPRAGATATDGVGLLLSELPARIDTEFFQKFVGPGTQLEPVVVGDTGWWITGALHEVAVVGRDGNVRFDSVRLAGSVLLWSSGPVTFRLETSRGLQDALEIARSVR
jgi:hypothetical protein